MWLDTVGPSDPSKQRPTESLIQSSSIRVRTPSRVPESFSPTYYETMNSISITILMGVPRLLPRQSIQPPVDGLLDDGRERALVRLGDGLRLELGAVRPAELVHGPLQRVALPPEDVVPVPAVAGLVAHAEHKGLAAVLRPRGEVAEGGGVPDGFVEDLREFYGVAGFAFASISGYFSFGFCCRG